MSATGLSAIGAQNFSPVSCHWATVLLLLHFALWMSMYFSNTSPNFGGPLADSFAALASALALATGSATPLSSGRAILSSTSLRASFRVVRSTLPTATSRTRPLPGTV